VTDHKDGGGLKDGDDEGGGKNLDGREEVDGHGGILVGNWVIG
jgi:hypothetical protein